MSSFPNSPRLIKAGIALLDPESGAIQRLIALQYNPDNTSGAGAKFVITGEIRSAGRDRMQSVMGFVDALSRDSVFTVGFSAVRLATTRASSAGGDEAEFVVECL